MNGSGLTVAIPDEYTFSSREGPLLFDENSLLDTQLVTQNFEIEVLQPLPLPAGWARRGSETNTDR